MTRQEVIDELWRRKEQPFNVEAHNRKAALLPLPTHAYCETTEPLTLRKWIDHKRNAKGEPIMVSFIIPIGTTLKIVMTSRFENFGLTDDLNADHGYHIRLDWDSPAITNLRLILKDTP